MFGEKEIIGIKNLKINKNRISLPPFTFATPNDELFFIFDHTQNHLILAQEQEIMANLSKIRENLKIKVSNSEITYKDFLRYQRYLYGIMCIEGHKVDSQKRILLPDRGLKKLNLSKEVLVVGKGTRLHIYPNTEEVISSLNI